MPSRFSISDVLQRTAQLHPTRVAIVDERRALRYAEVWERAQRFANFLQDGLRLPPGARFLLVAPNRSEYSEVYFGGALAACVCVPVNPRLTVREAAVIAEDSQATLLVADPSQAELALGLVAEGFDGPVIWLSGPTTPPGPGGDYEQILADAAATGPGRTPAAGSQACLQIYTSGTTGTPKGAVLSHLNLAANAASVLAAGGAADGDVLVLTSPMSHVSAGARVISSVYAAATLHTLSRFDADRVVALIAGGVATTGLFVPAMVHSLVEAAAHADVAETRFRRFIYGTAPMPLPLLNSAIETFRCEFQQGYGLTECTGHAAVLTPADHLAAPGVDLAYRLGTVGRQAHGTMIRCVDDAGNDVLPGTPGEILVRGANVMEGYWRRPAETERALKGGWLHTGDVGVLDDQSYLRLVDRKSDMLVSGGFNVYPKEIETQLEAHPDLVEVAVVGMPDERWGEVPVAVVVRREGGPPEALEAAGLEDWCRARLADYKVPRRYVTVSELPRNPAGKVVKRELTARLEADDT